MIKKFIVLLFISLALSSQVLADNESMSPSPTSPPIPSPTPVVYILPYPGLLPGSPLYPLKAARDKIIDFFITAPLKKANFYLLQSDKHLFAGVLLAKGGNFKIAEETISKGENYLEMSLAKIKKAKEGNEAVDDILLRLHLSTLKHEDVIKDLIEKFPQPVKSGLENDLKRAEQIKNSVNEFQHQK